MLENKELAKCIISSSVLFIRRWTLWKYIHASIQTNVCMCY